MNKIEKSKTIPHTLIEFAEEAENSLEKLINGGEEPIFYKGIYAAADVKKQLKDDQHNKCAYCERFLNGDYGSVEHYRPKGGYKISITDNQLHKPGYYWLTYNWNNLLFSCSECNTSYKRNLFPLKDESERKIEEKDISNEQPLLINPATEDPGDFIGFHRYAVVPKTSNDFVKLKGKTTIDILKLNKRKELVSRRRAVWSQYESLEKFLKIGLKCRNQKIIDLTTKELEKLKSEDSEFTGMFKYQAL